MKEKYRALKVKELIELLRDNSDENATVIIGAYNGHVNTYACVDHVLNESYDAVSNDFFGTPGRMDKRLFDNNIESFAFIGSLFGECPNGSVDIGNDDTNTCIELLNGEDGDKDLLWKLNNFTYNKENNTWIYISNDNDIKDNDVQAFSISYRCSDKKLEIAAVDRKLSDCTYTYKGYCYGIEDLYKALESCHIKKRLIK